MDKYKNKYRIESTRLPNWDYGSAAMYFITICTQNREHYFGEIIEGEMQLTEIGKTVEIEWLKTFDMRKDMNLDQGEFVVMPNHFHAIIGIGLNDFNANNINPFYIPEDARDYKNCFGPQSKNLASIVRGFKSSVTVVARKSKTEFQWQARYHDHVIRNNASWQRISQYIIDNPTKWQEDRFY